MMLTRVAVKIVDRDSDQIVQRFSFYADSQSRKDWGKKYRERVASAERRSDRYRVDIRFKTKQFN